MHTCPHCDTPLGLSGFLTMHTSNRPRCEACGLRYGWKASPRGIALVIGLGTVGALLLAALVPVTGLPGVLVAIVGLVLACGWLASRSMTPVKLENI